MTSAFDVVEAILVLLLLLAAFFRVWSYQAKKSFGPKHTPLLLALGGTVIVFVEMLIFSLESQEKPSMVIVGIFDTVGFGTVFASCIMLYIYDDLGVEPAALRKLLGLLTPAFLALREVFELADVGASKPSPRYLAITFALIFHFLLLGSLIVASIFLRIEFASRRKFAQRTTIAIILFIICTVFYIFAAPFAFGDAYPAAGWLFLIADITFLAIPFLHAFIPDGDANSSAADFPALGATPPLLPPPKAEDVQTKLVPEEVSH